MPNFPNEDKPTGHSAQPVAPTDVEAKLEHKMAQIKQRQLEHEVANEASRLGYGYLNLTGFPIDQESLRLITEAKAKQFQIICIGRTANELRLALSNPDQPGLADLIAEISQPLRLTPALFLVSAKSLTAALKLYDTLPKIRPTVSGVEITAHDLERFRREPMELTRLSDRISQTPLTETLSLILAGAIQSEATDIHIEAESDDVKLRYRIDGVLHTVATLPKSSWRQLISRIKLLAQLKLNIEDQPQDGRLTLVLDDGNIDVRVSTVPTAFGESVALRLLLSSATGFDLGELGLRGQPHQELERQIKRPNGLIVTTGPTGSGKTTTLYACLKLLNQPQSKIITLEDPIEYRLAGVNQSQVEPEKGYTFVRGLKHALRQDPDIIMVGEIRDLETAEIAIQATLTGHLVLSTLHTNNAAGAIPRFLSMGVKPYLLAPALNAVVAQRLVRRLCPQCKQPAELEAETQERVRQIIDTIPGSSPFRIDPHKPPVFYKPVGCLTCHGIGYRGRVGLFEIMTANPELAKLILAGNPSELEIVELAVKHGMLTMVQDGILKASEGITSIEEVFRVVE